MMTVKELKEMLNRIDENTEITMVGYESGEAELQIWNGKEFKTIWVKK